MNKSDRCREPVQNARAGVSRAVALPRRSDRVSAVQKHNARMSGAGPRTIMFAHGFGCDQNMWRLVSPAFDDGFRTIVFDHVGAGGSDVAAFDPTEYGALSRYAADVVALARELGLRDAIYVGHSVSAMIGALASIEAPELFSDLVMIGPSPRYIDDQGYVGGFTAAQIDELLEFLSENPMAWSRAMAPVIMGNPERPRLAEELEASFCRTDPEMAKAFARATFLSDNRADLRNIKARTLVLQCSDDVIAPESVGRYVHENVANSELVLLAATGHCPNLSAPDEVIAAISAFV